ncbi:glycosyltransferase family 4 protein [Paenibacillus sp. y28]|uniref:glycosyltransferase family 4 protein n=1 Tax=Paenibacillus sp. y28 TaxID=3129110 RepID=UPI003018ED37
MSRLLILSPVAERGGAERVMLDILKYLNRDRFEVAVVFFEEGSLVEEVRQLGYPVHVLPAGRLRNIGMYWKVIGGLRALIRSLHIDAVVSWMPKAHLYGGIAAALERIKALWWQHNMPGHLLDRTVSRIPASGVLCPSRVTRDCQERLTPRIPVLHNHLGVDIGQFMVQTGAGREIRERYGIPLDATVFAFVGRLQRWKRPDLVIRAFQRLKGGSHVYLLIVGGALFGIEEDYEQELRHLAMQGGGDTGQIIFLGHQKEVPAILDAADVMVHASWLEPFGMVVVEAMASGKPVIASGRGGPREIITDGSDGLLFDGTEEGLVRRMQQLLNGEIALEAMGDKARQTVESRFTVHRMTEQFETNVQFLLNAK